MRFLLAIFLLQMGSQMTPEPSEGERIRLQRLKQECHGIIHQSKMIVVPYNYPGLVCGTTIGDSQVCMSHEEFRKLLKISMPNDVIKKEK